MIRALLLSLLCAGLLFPALPQIDLGLSRLFYTPGHGFELAGLPVARLAREIFRAAGNLIGVLALLCLLASWRIGPARQVPARTWLYGLLLPALGPGLLVNLVIKPLWGRARPADVLPFGGPHSFSAALVPSDQCSWACSFVSGEAAAAAALSILLGLLLWHAVSARGRIWLVAILTLYALLVGGLRIAMGRHFLSDVVFGYLVTGFTAVALFRALHLAEALPHLTPARLRADIRTLLRRGGPNDRGDV